MKSLESCRAGASSTLIVAAAGAALALSGCDLLSGGLGFTEPVIALRSANLVQSPGIMALGAYFCPDLVGGGVNSTLCSLALGPRPPLNALNFYFDLDFDAGNNGPVPIPIVEALVGLNLFPGAAQQSLGTACVTFCEPSDPTCAGNSGPGACAEPTPGAGGWDLAAAAAGLIFVAAEEGPQGVANNLRVRTIPPKENINLRMTFGIDPLQVLGVIKNLGVQAATKLAVGQGAEIDIPYSVRGNLFYDVSRFGRFDLPFGPFDSTWSVTD